MARYSEVYQSVQWDKARSFVFARETGLCERCRKKGKIKPGKIVHHRIWLTDTNKNDFNIAYNPENLELICNECHEEEHRKPSITADGLVFDSSGQLVKAPL